MLRQSACLSVLNRNFHAVVLTLAAATLTARGGILYQTGFETTGTPPFTAGVGTVSTPRLVGTDNWAMVVNPSTIATSACYPFAGIDSYPLLELGQTAALGCLDHVTFTAPPSGTQFIRVGRKVDTQPGGLPVIDFYCQIGLTQSTNGHSDDFELLVYNWDDKVLGGLTFDLTQSKLFRYDANEFNGVTFDPYTDTGLSLSSLYGKVVEVTMRVNYQTNTWTATVGGVQVAGGAQFTRRPTTGANAAARTFGSLSARWYITTVSSPGNNWMLFNDWTITNSTPSMPTTASAGYAANSTAAIAVTDAGSVGWTIVSDQTWAVVSPLSGTGSSTVTVTCAANPNTTTRSATLTVGTQTCTLTQAAAPAVTTIPATASAGYAANSTASVAVTSNTTWSASSSQTWAVVSPLSGSGNGTLTVTCAANPNTTTRSATLTVGTQTCTLTQAAAPAVTTIPATASAGYAANSTASVAVTSNTTWIASSSQTWAVVSPLSGSGNGTLTVTCAANPNTTTRSATLTVGTQTCVLTQAASPFAAWAAGLPQNNQGFTQDADHDGVSNGVEYALGRDASIASGSNGIAQLPLNTLAGTGSLRHLTMTLSLPLTAPADIVYDVQASNNLTSWTTIMEKSGSGLWSAIGNSGATVVSTPDGSGRSSYAITDAVGYHFMRLAVTSTSAAAPVTTVSATASALYAANSTASVQVTSNTNWTASSNQAWAVVSPSSGSGNGTLTVTCAANATATPRSAVITIGTQTCVLTQAAWPYAIWATNLTQGTQGFGMDADHDGVSNGMEYALGRNAASASGINGIAQLPLITAAGNSASRHLTMTLSLPDPAPVDITYDVEVTNSLSDPWITIMEKAGTGTWAALGNPSATVSSSPAGSGRTAYTITDVQGHHFMRLAVKSL